MVNMSIPKLRVRKRKLENDAAAFLKLEKGPTCYRPEQRTEPSSSYTGFLHISRFLPLSLRIFYNTKALGYLLQTAPSGSIPDDADTDENLIVSIYATSGVF